MAVFLSGGQNLAGASHDGLDIAKVGGKRIRRWGKAGVLGRGARGGRRAKVGRHGAAGGSSGRRGGQARRQEERTSNATTAAKIIICQNSIVSHRPI